MPRISQILIVLAIVATFFMVLLVYRFMTLKPAYEFLDKTPKVETVTDSPIYDISENAKG